MNQRYHISLIFFTLLLTACIGGNRVSEALQTADKLIFVAPDSAVIMLDSLDLDHASRAQRAHHALLLTKAREKANITVTDDSLIAVAADYYRGHGDSLEVQSLFYHGVILGYRGDYSKALIALMEAADRAATNGDDFYRAMAYREQADNYNQLHSITKRAEYAELAAKYFDKSNKPLHALREKLMLAQSLILLNQTSKARSLLSDIRKDTLLNKREFGALYHRTMERYSYLCNDFTSSLFHSESVKYYSGNLSSIEFSNRSLSASALAMYDSASAYLTDAHNTMETKVDSANYLYALAQFYAAKGDYEQFYNTFIKYYADEIRIHNHLLSHPYTNLLTQHYALQSEKNLLKYSQTRRYAWLLLIISFLLAIVVICLIIIFRNRSRIKQERVEILMSELSHFKSKVRLMESNIAEQQITTNNRNINYPFLPIINSLYDMIASLPDSEKKHYILGKNVDKLISNFHAEGIYSELEEYIDATASNLMKRFREQVGGISNKKNTAAILIFAGFSNNFICAALHYSSISSVRSLKKRLKEDIISSAATDKSEFLSYF